ncbi:hypothetical protein NMG60_11036240 [Bertholletia excelsa]
MGEDNTPTKAPHSIPIPQTGADCLMARMKEVDSSPSARKKKKQNEAMYMKVLQSILEANKAFASMNNPLTITTVEMVVQALQEIPDFAPSLLCQALKKLENPTRCRMFLALTLDMRRTYIDGL